MFGLDQHPQRERGQVLVIFAIALVAIVAMTGLVLDGGSTFVQRRDEQNVADGAAMAGAYDYTWNHSVSSAVAAAQATAAANGYTDGQNGVSVAVSVNAGGSGEVDILVNVTKPHANNFSGIVGLSSWNVSTTATAISGGPNGAVGAMPVLFNKKAFNSNGNGPSTQTSYNEPGTGTQDVPQDAATFNWTVYCTANGNACNGNSSTVDALINGNGTSTVVTLNDLIGPLNAGAHTTLFSDLAAYVGQDFPVSVVNDEGALVGWAMFHLTGSVGGSTKQISGYFVSPVNPSNLVVVQNGGNGTTLYGSYTVQLTN